MQRLTVAIEQACDGDGELELTLLAQLDGRPIGPEGEPLALDLAELRRSSYTTGALHLLFDPRSGRTTPVRLRRNGAELVWSFTIGASELELRFDARAYERTVADLDALIARWLSREGAAWRSVRVRRPGL